MTRQIHQFHGLAAYGDAIGNQLVATQRLLRDRLGYPSEIFSENVRGPFEAQALNYRDYVRFSSPDNILICRYSVAYSPDVLAWLSGLPDRKILIYHNITPHHYFMGINQVLYEATRMGRAQLKLLRRIAPIGWGDSDFNRQELIANGWQHTAVQPLVFDPAMVNSPPDFETLQQLRKNPGNQTLNVLFASRVAPNKRFEDVILVFHYLKQIAPYAKLWLVGIYDDTRRYFDYLQALVKKLNLTDVTFGGHVSRAQLTAYFQAADVYLSMSEHEGFGMTLLESMYHGVPVIAYKAAAVSETMGPAGLLITKRQHAEIAELIYLVANNSDLRDKLIKGQHARWQNFLPLCALDTLKRNLGLFP